MRNKPIIGPQRRYFLKSSKFISFMFNRTPTAIQHTHDLKFLFFVKSSVYKIHGQNYWIYEMFFASFKICISLTLSMSVFNLLALFNLWLDFTSSLYDFHITFGRFKKRWEWSLKALCHQLHYAQYFLKIPGQPPQILGMKFPVWLGGCGRVLWMCCFEEICVGL